MSSERENIRRKVHARQEEEAQIFGKAPEPMPESETTRAETKEIPSPDILQALDRNTDGDADLFVRLHRGVFVYDHSVERWFIFSEHSWHEDVTDQSIKAIRTLVDKYVREAAMQAWQRAKYARCRDQKAEKEHESKERALLKRIKALQSLKRKNDILVLARSGNDTLALTGDEWDLDPWLLGVANGVVNLKDGSFRAGRPEDYIKTAAPTKWQGLSTACPTWERFLTDVFDGDKELISFIWRLLGYGLIGLQILHYFIILWGVGRNGKGTLLETLHYVLGNYTLKAEAELLLEQRHARMAGAPNSSILSLRGRRIVWASETSEGRRFNVGRLKELVGGDTLNARPVFGKHHIQFRPTHLLLLLTNAKPSAPASDYALWQRIFLVPFKLSFVENPRQPNERQADLNLNDKLKAEASGILSWLVRGCLAWQQEGLRPPEIVKAATSEYRKEEDLVERFLADRCLIGQSYEIQAGILYRKYTEWAEDMGLKPITGIQFGKEMQTRFESYQKRYVFYIGVRLHEEG